MPYFMYKMTREEREQYMHETVIENERGQTMKEILKVFPIRLRESSILKLSKIAHKKHLPVRTMVRVWIMERIETESDKE